MEIDTVKQLPPDFVKKPLTDGRCTLSDLELEDAPSLVRFLYRIHSQTIKSLEKREISDFWLNGYIQQYKYSFNNSYYGKTEEKQFIQRYVDSISQFVKDYNNVDHFYKIPIHVDIHSGGLSSLDHYFFDKIMKGEEDLAETLREQPFLSVFTPLFNSISQFLGQYYNNLTGMIEYESSYSGIINLFTTLIRIFGFEPRINDYLRDVDGNILMNKKFTLICPELNIIVSVGSDLSSETENDWKDVLLSSNILQRTNNFGFSDFAYAFMLHSNSVSYFRTEKLEAYDTPTHFGVNFIRRFNIAIREQLYKVIAEVWMNMFSCILRESMPNPFVGTLSKEDVAQVSHYLVMYISEHLAFPETYQALHAKFKKSKHDTKKAKHNHTKIRKHKKKDESELINAIKRLDLQLDRVA